MYIFKNAIDIASFYITLDKNDATIAYRLTIEKSFGIFS